MSRRRTVALSFTAAVMLSIGAWLVLRAVRQPSNDRNWSVDQAVLPSAVFEGDFVTVRNIRNFTYGSESEYVPRYYDQRFDLRELDSVWFIVEPFGPWEGPAHTFVSFGFGGRDFVAISPEIRKEKGESFSPLRGILREYEVMYVVADERDAVKLRTNFRNDTVFVYPVKTTRERMRTMFVQMLQRANALHAEPEFYNTVTNSCAVNLARHVNAITPGRIPPHFALLLPAHSDRLALTLGLLDTPLSLEEARRRFRVNERAKQYADSADFSQRIRSSP